MKLRILLLSLALVAAATSSMTATAQTNPSTTSINTQPQQQPAPQKRKAALRKLQADLDQAVSRAKLTDVQKRDLASARATLQQQFDRRRNGEAMDREAFRASMKVLRGLAASEAFQPEDRTTLQNDLEALRPRNGQGRRNAPLRSGKSQNPAA